MTPEYEIRPIAAPVVQAWLRDADASNLDACDGKRFALMRRDRNGNLQVWSWHVSEAAARRAIVRTTANRPVR